MTYEKPILRPIAPVRELASCTPCLGKVDLVRGCPPPPQPEVPCLTINLGNQGSTATACAALDSLVGGG